MQQVVDVKRRMKAVADIGEVCRTLSTVAGAKLAQTRERALAARAYTEVLRAMTARQQAAAASAGVDLATRFPLMETRPVARAAVLVFGADRGLCGGYNVAVGRTARAFVERLAAQREGVEIELAAIGRRAESFLGKTVEVPVARLGEWTRAGVTDELVSAVLDRAVSGFIAGEVDEVWAVYTAFISAVQREPRVVRLLPIAAVKADADGDPGLWFYEPDQAGCVEELLGALVRLQVEDVLLESYASEQSARMVTMQEASERADRSLQELRVRYNRLRREAITSDLAGVLVAGRVRRRGSDGR